MVSGQWLVISRNPHGDRIIERPSAAKAGVENMAFIAAAPPKSKSKIALFYWPLITHHWPLALSISVKQVAGFEGEFAADFYDGDAAVDGVDVNEADGAGERGDLIDQIFIGGDDQDGGVVGTSMIGVDDEAGDLALGHAVNFFENHFHIGGSGGAHDEGDGLAIGPVRGLRFAELDQVGDGDGANGIGFVGNHRDVACGRQRSAQQNEDEDP